MKNRRMITVYAGLSLITLIIVVSIPAFFEPANASSGVKPASNFLEQTTGHVEFASISALAFEPVQPNAIYTKNTQRQLLSLATGERHLAAGHNLFIAPLLLPDRSELLAMTLYGEDFDSQGEIRLRLKRCDHSQPRCLILAETSSALLSAQGQFETPKVTIPAEVVNNQFFTYFLELELTALLNSGPRSVRLEIRTPAGSTAAQQGRWALTNDVYNFTLPTSGFTEARICTDDLSHLNNATHYPYLMVDGIPTSRLASNACQTVRGTNIEIRRDFNTGPSTGTYRF